MTKAIFLDRDGTINEEVNYLKKIQDIRIFPNTIEALQKFKNLGFINLVITNQSGIARGYFSEEDLNVIHNEFRKLLTTDSKELIDDIFYSPFHKDGVIEKYKVESEYRKPGTGMVMKAKEKYNVDLKESYFIGDSLADMKCAENSGLKKILVKTGYGKDEYQKCADENIYLDFFADDLYDASVYIEDKSLEN